MNWNTLMSDIDREVLEQMAMEAICVCYYYDLADALDAIPDHDLWDIINVNVPCELCDS